ncbi:zinc ribbon domain-containing protein [Saccharopolyspora pogona]|uniref:zinc ribbon domain-containing protein n=1 Tax=Saccharopolyspora pogona TaxID=333966 RepID=UPI0037CBB570
MSVAPCAQRIRAPYTSVRCSDCGWIDKNSRKSQAELVCSGRGFTCNADVNASINVAAGQDEGPKPGRACAGGTTPARGSKSVREPQLSLWRELESLASGEEGCQLIEVYPVAAVSVRGVPASLKA